MFTVVHVGGMTLPVSIGLISVWDLLFIVILGEIKPAHA
jgi:hypothetical protein